MESFISIKFQIERGIMSLGGAHILNPSLSKRRGASDLRKDMVCKWLLDRVMGKKQKTLKHTGPR